MKKRWMGLVMALALLAAVFPGRVGAREAAAETGGVCYPTLAGALEALESGGTLTLLRDETLAAMLVLNKNGTTLDLNGYSLAPAAEFSGSHDNARHLVEAAGTGITVKNGTLRAGANSWYGMNLDDRVYGESRPCGVTVEGRLHFAGPAALGALLDQSLGGAVRLAFAAGSRVSAEQDGFPAAVIGPTASGAQLIDPENGGLTRVESEQGIFYLTGAAESAPEPAPTPSPEPDPTAQPTAAPPAAPTASPSPTLPARTETQTVTVTARVESEAEAGVAAARPDPQTVRAGWPRRWSRRLFWGWPRRSGWNWMKRRRLRRWR